MSYLVFKDDLTTADLDLARFQKTFEFHSRKDKSILIDALTQFLGAKFHERAKEHEGNIDKVIIPKDHIIRFIVEFENEKIKEKFPPTKPILKPVPGDITNFPYDQRTSLVFKPMAIEIGSKDMQPVAIQVYAGGKLYDLNLNHILMCISNGWYFCIPKDKYPQISCVFRVYSQ